MSSVRPMCAAVADPRMPAVRRSMQRACPVCDADRPHALHDNAMASIDGFEFGYPVVACERCGMVYAGRSLDACALADYYRDLSKYDGVGTASEFDRHRAHAAAAFTRRFTAEEAAVLDVGCSTGTFLVALRAAGCARVAGIEPAPGAVERARAMHGLDVSCCAALDYPDYRRFDTVTVLAVLEHLLEPAKFFAAMARELRPGACLIVEVPDADRFGDYARPGVETEPFGEFSIEHINFFGRASLARLGEAAGLTPIGSESFTYLNGWAGLFAAFRKGGPQGGEVDRAGSRLSVARYVERSNAAMRAVDARLRRLADDGARAIVYGAGSHTGRLLRRPAIADLAIVAIVDRNPNLAGRMLHGLRIGPPDAIARHPDVPIVVSTFNARRSIRDDVARRFRNPVVDLYPD